jgi:hypothetical protein
MGAGERGIEREREREGGWVGKEEVESSRLPGSLVGVALIHVVLVLFVPFATLAICCASRACVLVPVPVHVHVQEVVCCVEPLCLLLWNLSV